MEKSLQPSQRDHGIDLLRILSMGMIVLIHLLNYGIGISSMEFGTAAYNVTWLLYSGAFFAVNAYAAISGYVGYKSRWKLSSLLNLYCQVFFYSASLFVLCYIVFPGSFSLKEVIRGFLPISMDIYWYFTIYAVLFFLMPGLNHMIRTLPLGAVKGFTLTLLVFLSLLPSLSGRDLFVLNSGYHLLWLTTMYITGGCLRRIGLPEKRPLWACLLVYLAAVLVAWLTHLANAGYGLDYYHSQLRYDAPAMVAAAVAMLFLFAGRKLPSWVVKLISFLSPLAFGVYLIHDHPAVRAAVIQDSLASLRRASVPEILMKLAFAWALVFSACLALEYLRKKIFLLLRIPRLCAWAESRLTALAARGKQKADV